MAKSLNSPLLEQKSDKKSDTMTKKKLIYSISTEKNIHASDVRQVIQAFLDGMMEALAEGERLEFRDFGVFEVVVRKAKIGRNPKNAAVPIVIPSRQAVKFTPGKKMRKLIEKLDFE
jgi:integration host factor subunit beta